MVKTKALISFAVTAKLVCAFVFTYAERFSYAAAQIITLFLNHDAECDVYQCESDVKLCFIGQ